MAAPAADHQHEQRVTGGGEGWGHGPGGPGRHKTKWAYYKGGSASSSRTLSSGDMEGPRAGARAGATGWGAAILSVPALTPGCTAQAGQDDTWGGMTEVPARGTC